MEKTTQETILPKAEKTASSTIGEAVKALNNLPQKTKQNLLKINSKFNSEDYIAIRSVLMYYINNSKNNDDITKILNPFTLFCYSLYESNKDVNLFKNLDIDLFNVPEVSNFYNIVLEKIVKKEEIKDLLVTFKNVYEVLINESIDLKKTIINNYTKIIINNNIFYVKPELIEKFSLPYIKTYLFKLSSYRKDNALETFEYISRLNKPNLNLNILHPFNDFSKNKELDDKIPTFKEISSKDNSSKASFKNRNLKVNLDYLKINIENFKQFKNLDIYCVQPSFYNTDSLSELSMLLVTNICNIFFNSDFSSFLQNYKNITPELLNLNLSIKPKSSNKSLTYSEENVLKLIKTSDNKDITADEFSKFKVLNKDLATTYNTLANKMDFKNILNTCYNNQPQAFRNVSSVYDILPTDVFIPGFEPLRKSLITIYNSELFSNNMINLDGRYYLEFKLLGFYNSNTDEENPNLNISNEKILIGEINLSTLIKLLNNLLIHITDFKVHSSKNLNEEFDIVLKAKQLLDNTNNNTKYKAFIFTTNRATNYNTYRASVVNYRNTFLNNFIKLELVSVENSIKAFGNKSKKQKFFDEYNSLSPEDRYDLLDSVLVNKQTFNYNQFKLNYLSETLKGKGFETAVNYIIFNYEGENLKFVSTDFKFFIRENIKYNILYKGDDKIVLNKSYRLVSKKTLFKSKIDIIDFCSKDDLLLFLKGSSTNFTNYNSGKKNLDLYYDVLNIDTQQIASVNSKNLKYVTNKTLKNVKKKESIEN